MNINTICPPSLQQPWPSKKPLPLEERKQLQGLFAQAKELSHPANRTLVLQGDIPKFAYILVEGKLEKSCVSENGHRRIVSVEQDFIIIGGLELLTSLPYQAEYKTLTLGRFLQLTKSHLMRCFESPAFVRLFANVEYDRQLREARKYELDYFGDLSEKIMACLILYSDNSSTFVGSQDLLADLIGCARQTLNRELKKLADHNLVKLSSRKIEILHQSSSNSNPSTRGGEKRGSLSSLASSP